MKSLLMTLCLTACTGDAANFAVNTTAYSIGSMTATGKVSVPGQIALSPDLLRVIPYGSLVKVQDSSGKGCGGYTTGILTVEDRTADHVFQTADIKVASRSTALRWGKCKSTLRVVRYGRG